MADTVTGPSQAPGKETLAKKCNKVPWAVTDKGNICVVTMTDQEEGRGGGGAGGGVLGGKNTHACRKHSGKVVGTVHLVANGNLSLLSSIYKSGIIVMCCHAHS